MTLCCDRSNIKEERFGLEYFQTFQLVINALDNVAARRHVNRLCLSANVPLIEAGTTGYRGQAFVIKKGATMCYECDPKPTQKKYPICTIRSTPEKPVHAVVWAKELHKLLFGDKTASYLYDATTSNSSEGNGSSSSEEDGAREGAGAGSSSESESAAAASRNSAYAHLVNSAPTADGPAPDVSAVRAWAEQLFDAIFHDEIAERLRVAPDTFKTAARPPVPIGLSVVRAGSLGAETVKASAAAAIKDQRVLSLAESAELFLTSLVGYYTDPAVRITLGSMEFSKDSALDLDFVTAATNLRAYTFAIPMQSRWDVKSIAGNIIPAIATTNAIVAGLEVLEAVKIIRGDDVRTAGRYTWVNHAPGSGGTLLSACKVEPPKPSCFVCGTQGVTLFVDTSLTSLGTFIDVILKGSLGFNHPHIDNNGGFCFINDRRVRAQLVAGFCGTIKQQPTRDPHFPSNLAPFPPVTQGGGGGRRRVGAVAELAVQAAGPASGRRHQGRHRGGDRRLEPENA